MTRKWSVKFRETDPGIFFGSSPPNESLGQDILRRRLQALRIVSISAVKPF